MCLPTTGDDQRSTTLSSSLSDLESNRDDVVEQVMKAPKRRIDNVITNLYDSTSMLQLYSKIWNDVAVRYRRKWMDCRLQEGGWTTLGVATLGGMNHLGLDAVYQGGVLGTSIIGVGGLVWYHQHFLRSLQQEMTSMDSLSASFQRTHARHVQDADEFVASLFTRLRDPLQRSLQAAFEENGKLTAVSAKELQKLDNILDDEIPELRRRAASATK
jgi:hypothetical protein